MNKLKWLYCADIGNYLLEVVCMVLMYMLLSLIEPYYILLQYDYMLIIIALASGRILFGIQNYIFYQKICRKYKAYEKMMTMGTLILLAIVILVSFYQSNIKNQVIISKTNNISQSEVRLYIYKGYKKNGKRRKKYEIVINQKLQIKDIINRKNEITNLPKSSIEKVYIYINKFNKIESKISNALIHPADINIDIRTSRNLIVSSLSNLKYTYKNLEDQKLILEFLAFIKKESNNTIDLNYHFTKENLESLKNK